MSYTKTTNFSAKDVLPSGDPNKIVKGSEINNEFTKQFFVDEGNDIFSLKDDKINELKEKFKGKVSYLGPIVSNIKKKFIGQTIGNLEHFIVYPEKMENFQGDVYIKALKQDSETKGIYSNSRQAILFVYPDGSYGETGFKKYIEEKKIID